MKYILRIALPLVLILGAAWVLMAQNNDKVTPARAQELMASTKNLVVLDVRTTSEYASGHLANAISIDVTKPDFEKRISKLDTKRPILVYCAVGGRSARATAILKQGGFTVYDLLGGITRWQREKLPIVQ